MVHVCMAACFCSMCIFASNLFMYLCLLLLLRLLGLLLWGWVLCVYSRVVSVLLLRGKIYYVFPVLLVLYYSQMVRLYLLGKSRLSMTFYCKFAVPNMLFNRSNYARHLQNQNKTYLLYRIIGMLLSVLAAWPQHLPRP